MSDDNSLRKKYSSILKRVALFSIIGLGAFAYSRYKVSAPNSFLVRTGFLINDISISKKCIQLPLQKIFTLELTPKSYSLTIHAMSSEKMEFVLPCVFTIGPKDSDDHLIKFSKYLMSETPENISNIIKGIIEGETRVLAANLSVEKIFKDRNTFKVDLIHKIEEELTNLGLTVYNANIKELQDSKDSKYFTSLAQKISADAENQAKVDIAEANKRGSIGQKEREGQTRQRTAEIESVTVLIENEKKIDIAKSQAEVDKKKAEYFLLVKLAQIESEKGSEKRAEEMQKEVEMKKLEKEVEKERAEKLSKAKVEAEIKQALAHGESIAIRIKAEADLFRRQKEAEAVLYNNLKEAEGILAMYESKATGLMKISSSFGNDNKALLNYLMIENKLYPELAEASAKAIQGLNPKITIWNTGGDSKSTYDPILNIVKAVPPILEAIQQQTNLKIPDFLRKDCLEKTENLEKLLDNNKINKL